MSNYPLPNFHFKVDWGGARQDFTEVKGLDRYIEPILMRDGNSPESISKIMPGTEKFNTITLRRTIQKGDTDFFDWMNTKNMSTIERRDVTISLLNEEHNPVMRWKAQSAFPVRYSGPIFNSSNNEAAYEELELVHERLSLSV